MRTHQEMLVEILGRIRKLGVEMVRVDDLAAGKPTDDILIPHDGHPSAQANRVYAEKLLNFLRTQPFIKRPGALSATNSPARPSAP